MHRKTVLITGATGLLGSQILSRLIRQEYTLYALKRASSIIPFQEEKINWIEVNSIEENPFRQIPATIDFVIHAAAMVSYKKSDRAEIFRVNTEWTEFLAKYALNAAVKKFIFISSISALSKNSNSHYVDEKTPRTDGGFMSNYGISKRQAEAILWDLSAKGLPILIFNPSVIIGPAKRYQSSAQLFGYVADQKPFYTKGFINYIDVRDVADIVVESLQTTIENEQFLLNAGSTSYQNFFVTIAKQLQVKAPWIGIPKFVVVLGAIMENIISKLNGKPATLSMETAKMAGNKHIYIGEKAKNAFNIPSRSLEESIEWTVSIMRQNGEL